MIHSLRGTVTTLSKVTKRHVNQNHQGVSVGPNLPKVSRKYITELSVNGQPARLSFNSPAHIDQDDEVALTGLKFFGKLHAYAYKNLSKNTTGHGDIFSGLIFGVFTFLIGFLLTPRGMLLVNGALDTTLFPNPYTNSELGNAFRIFSWAFWSFSLFALATTLRNLLALMSVRDA